MKKYKIILILVLLIFIGVISRIPITNEQGVDSFLIHNLASNIKNEGYASWSSSLLSIAGFTQFSYQAGASFLLAIISLMINEDINIVLIILSIIWIAIGSLSTYKLYLQFRDKKHEAIITSFLFIISPLIFYHSYYSLSARVIISSIIPILLLILIKYEQNKKIKFLFLFLIISLSCIFIHRMSIMIFFILIPSFLLYLFINQSKEKKWLKYFFIFFLSIIFLLFILQFTNIIIYKQYRISYQTGFFFKTGYAINLYNNILIFSNIIIDFLSSHVMLPLFSAIFIFLFLYDKVYLENEKHILLTILLFILLPILIFSYYTNFFYVTIFILTGTMGFFMLLEKFNLNEKFFIPIFIILSLFGSIFMILHWYDITPYKTEKMWIRDSTMKSIDFIDTNIEKNDSILISDFILNQRYRAVSDNKFLPANKIEDIEVLSKKIEDVEKVKSKKSFKKIFYSGFKKILEYDLDPNISYFDWGKITRQTSETPIYKNIKKKYNTNYALEHKNSTHLNRNIYKYIIPEKNKIYDNSQEYIWDIR